MAFNMIGNFILSEWIWSVTLGYFPYTMEYYHNDHSFEIFLADKHGCCRIFFDWSATICDRSFDHNNDRNDGCPRQRRRA